MGTRTIKPLSNNAGQLGSSTRYWNKGYINELYINDLHTSSTSTLAAHGISVTANSGIIFEGGTADDHELQITATNPTADRIIVFPDATGTLALTSDIGVTSLSGTTVDGLTTYATTGVIKVEEYLTFANGGNISRMEFLSNEDTGDKFQISTTTHGATTLATFDDDSDAAHLHLNVDGNIILDPVCDHSTTGIILQNEGTQFGIINVHHSASYLTLYENGGASTDDFGTFRVEADGVTTISSWDAAGTDADIVLDADGNIELNAETGTIDFKDSSAQLAKINSDGLSFRDNLGAKIIFDGSTDDANFTLLEVTDPTAERTVTLPDDSGTVQLQGSKTGQTFSVPLKNDDLYVLYVSAQNYWYHTGYAGQNFGTSIGSETDSVAMRAVSYIATANCKVNNVVVAFYSTQSADLEFQVTKIPLVDDDDNNVTLAAMTHNDINFSMAANYNYVKTMTMTGGGSNDNHLLKGQAFTLAIRRTDATGTRVLYGNCFAEIELT